MQLLGASVFCLPLLFPAAAKDAGHSLEGLSRSVHFRLLFCLLVLLFSLRSGQEIRGYTAAAQVHHCDVQSPLLCFCFLGLTASPGVEVPAPLPATSALEEMALYSNKRKLRQGRRSLETAVPT